MQPPRERERENAGTWVIAGNGEDAETNIEVGSRWFKKGMKENMENKAFAGYENLRVNCSIKLEKCGVLD